MALNIDKTIDLTAYAKNPAPKVVYQLSIIHESNNGELVQYYINPADSTQRDKASHAIGVYNEETRHWEYREYDAIEWDEPKQRITGALVERLTVKSFPAMGAFAVYKILGRKISRIVIPVNRTYTGNPAPEIEVHVNSDGTITFNITPPEKPEYVCYRIVLQAGYMSEEYITYSTTFTAPQPKVTGEYRCYVVGYADEGQLFSMDSNIVTLNLRGESDTWKRPYYSRSEIDTIAELIDTVLDMLGTDTWMDYDNTYIVDHDEDYIVFY